MKNLKVGQILGAAFGGLIALLIVVAAVAANRLTELDQKMVYLASDRVPKLVMLDKWRVALLQSSRHMRNMFLYDPAEIPAEIKKLESTLEARREAFQYFEKNATSETGRKMLQEITVLRDRYLAAETELVKQVKAGNLNEARTVLIEQNRPILGEFLTALDKLAAYQVEQTAKAVESANAAYVTGLQILTACGAIAVLLAIVMAVMITRHITGVLGGEPAHAADVVRRIAGGDLTQAVQTRPGDRQSMLLAIKEMQAALHQMITGTHRVADSLVSSAHTLAAASQQVAQGTDQQSQSASAMAAAVEELTVSINHVADSAKSAHDLAGEAGSFAREGATLVQDTVAEINKIAATVESSATEVNHLGEQSDKISGIVNVIKGIADQTNLLALNAAIEAARAGEQGRGFAVVADEVRKLAERTTLSTQEITTMIADIQRGTEAAVKGMTDGQLQVGEGVAKAERSGRSMEHIQSSALTLIDSVEEISTALREQSAASNDVALNVEKIAQMTEENSMAINSVSNAARDLETLAGELQANVNRFRV